MKITCKDLLLIDYSFLEEAVMEKHDFGHIWCGEGLEIKEIEKYYTTLSNEELIRADKFKDDEARQLFLVSHIALRQVLGKYLTVAPDKINYSVNKHGKPFIENKELHFNLSHSKDWYAIVLSDKPCGIDLEYLNNQFEFNSMVDKFFHLNEIEEMAESNNRPELFYKFWTRKESILKNLGVGVSMEMECLNVLDGSRQIDLPGKLFEGIHDDYMQVITFYPDVSYPVSVTVDQRITNLKFFSVNHCLLPSK